MALYLLRSGTARAPFSAAVAALPRPHGIVWCECEDGIASVPGAGQAACPWCGCGWLFTCSLCRKAFTFATAVDVGLSLEAVRDLDQQRFEASPGSGDAAFDRFMIEERRKQSQTIHDVVAGLRAGAEYAYLDGRLVALGEPLDFVGRSGRHHRSDQPPQEALREKPRIAQAAEDALCDRARWRARAS